jgi:NADPH:quinone reductase-like Zn-dependent oxidoreductase
MTRRKRILAVVLAVTGVAAISLGYAMSYDAPCDAAVAATAGLPHIKAVRARCYGSPDILTLEDIDKPVPAENEVLVKVHAAALNPLDWHYMRGKPYVMRLGGGFGKPDDTRVGVDFAGVVESVGSAVTRFKAGDEVFGGKNGAFAEYVIVQEDRAVLAKPANISFEQAAAIPIAAVTALQGLRDTGQIRAGQRVLINGASGGVGTFAVQIAKSFGAEVTAVCSTRNVELVKALGADHVIDYTQEDFTRGTQHYDLILDNVGNHSLSAYRRVMTPEGIVSIVGGPNENAWLGPLVQPIKGIVLSPFSSQRFAMFIAELNVPDLELISDLIRQGKITPVIDRRYALSEVPEAIRYLETGRARGKVIVTVCSAGTCTG